MHGVHGTPSASADKGRLLLEAVVAGWSLALIQSNQHRWRASSASTTMHFGLTLMQ